MQRKNIFIIALFWGALWGLAEATLGYLAHLVTFIPGIAGFIMFPIGFYFINRASREKEGAAVIMATAAVAASIKLVDLFLPGLPLIKTVNPAVFILLEAVGIIVISRLVRRNTAHFRFPEALTASILWRAGFIAYSLALAAFSINGEFIRIGFSNIFLRFLIFESAINAVIIWFYLLRSQSASVAGKGAFLKLQARPVAAVSLLFLAAAVRIGLHILG